MPMTFVPMESRHLAAAAALLAARHRRDREREPALPAAFESAEAVRPHLERTLQRAGSAGVVAVRGSESVGFLLSVAMLPAPTDLMAQFFPPRSLLVPYHGHAVAEGEDPSLYRELYAALADGWVRRGFFDHFANVPALDLGAREAWDSLGFARDSTCAAREVGAPVAVNTARVEVHRAGPEDIDVIEGLADALWRHHTLSPIFSPHLPEPTHNSREGTLELLREPGSPAFVAYREGTPLGMNTFMTPAFLSPLLAPEACTYLFQGVVYPDARGDGVGRALLAHSMRWAQEEGHRWCALHFASANVSGARFWLSNGFRPIEHRLRRRIDERVAWAGR